jgi:hypothetical protein
MINNDDDNFIFTHNESEVWILIDNNEKKGDCGTLATLMVAAIKLLGDDSAEVLFVYPRHQSWGGLVNDDDSEINPVTGEDLGFMAPEWNNYEGCCLFQHKWWVGGLGTSKSDPYEVLMYVTLPNNSPDKNRQVWYNNTLIPVSYPTDDDVLNEILEYYYLEYYIY